MRTELEKLLDKVNSLGTLDEERDIDLRHILRQILRLLDIALPKDKSHDI